MCHTLSRPRVTIVTICLSLAAPILFAADPQRPPAAPVRPVTDEYYGHRISDPYQYMENLKDPAIQAWIKSQADYTSSVLALIPGREKLQGRLHELNTAATARVSNLNVVPGPIVFYEKTLATENVSRLYMRRGIAGDERLLVDPTRLDKTGDRRTSSTTTSRHGTATMSRSASGRAARKWRSFTSSTRPARTNGRKPLTVRRSESWPGRTTSRFSITACKR